MGNEEAEALLSRRRRAAGWCWAVLVMSLAVTGAGVAGLVLLDEGPGLASGLAVCLGACGALTMMIFAPWCSVDVRRFERDLAAARAATGDRTPEPTGLLEIDWRPEGHGLVLWNGAEAGAVTGPGIAGIVWPGEVPSGEGWDREMVSGVMPYLRMTFDGRRYLLAEMSLLVDGHGRGWPVPRVATVRSGDPVRVELPGELGPLGAPALLVAMAFVQNRANAMARQARSEGFSGAV